MPDTPLNPDALTRRDIMAGQIGVWIDEWDDGKADTGHVATHIANRLAENGVTTLAAAQPEGWEQQAKNFMRVIDRLSAENETLKAAALPEVTSVEELDQLPDDTVALDDAGAVLRKWTANEWYATGDDQSYMNTEIGLPARVLYRPEVNDA